MAERGGVAVPPETGPRSTRIVAMVLGTSGAVVGGGTALSAVFAPAAPDFTIVPASLLAGLAGFAFAVPGAVGAAETPAHPRLAGALMLVAAFGGLAAVGGDFGVAPALLSISGVLALTLPPVRPHHHRVPAILRVSRG